jgi:TolB-like protein
MRALKLLPFLALALTSLLMAACETSGVRNEPEPTYQEAANDLLRPTNYKAIDMLMGRDAGPASASNQTSAFSALIVTTLADVNALEKSSALGRLVSEHIASRLTQNGHKVVELKMRNSVYMKLNQGEFILTREIKEVAAEHNAQGIIVGLYAASDRFVQITLKLIDPATGLVLASHDYVLPQDRQVKSLLRK